MEEIPVLYDVNVGYRSYAVRLHINVTIFNGGKLASHGMSVHGERKENPRPGRGIGSSLVQ